MKTGSVFLTIFISFFVILPARLCSASDDPAIPYPIIVAVDPGHGGYDPGATFGNIMEKNINLALCEKLKEHLESKGILVILTREGDYNHAIKGLHGREAKRYDLDERIEMVDSNHAQILLTVHVNKSKKASYAGAEVFYHPKSLKGKILASYIQEELRNIPEMKKRISKISMCYLLCKAKTPAALIEIGYLSNPSEREKLKDPAYLDLIAEKIAAGTIKYLTSPDHIYEYVLTFLPVP
ncbi:hypothetical protein DCMF_05595 [Candidatus Formimonas warabiya]|uniref:MurNAc-LAA domain-containing protein n=2 Tax=Formimonas warabiya TaxID=1761012 RepID=A0A3G1L150_FORW1|nr:hypothetical protein DCMF_05595 [Candidatus Formimonas warabiya]